MSEAWSRSPDAEYRCPNGHPVRPPADLGRSWCRVCDEYLIAVEYVPAEPAAPLDSGLVVHATSKVEVLPPMLQTTEEQWRAAQGIGPDPFGYIPTVP